MQDGENTDFDQHEEGWWIQDGASVNTLRGRCVGDHLERKPASVSPCVTHCRFEQDIRFL